MCSVYICKLTYYPFNIYSGTLDLHYNFHYCLVNSVQSLRKYSDMFTFCISCSENNKNKECRFMGKIAFFSISN